MTPRPDTTPNPPAPDSARGWGDDEARRAGPDGAVLWRPEHRGYEPRARWPGGAW